VYQEPKNNYDLMHSQWDYKGKIIQDLQRLNQGLTMLKEKLLDGSKEKVALCIDASYSTSVPRLVATHKQSSRPIVELTI
jgi:hypothetical protein